MPLFKVHSSTKLMNFYKYLAFVYKLSSLTFCGEVIYNYQLN